MREYDSFFFQDFLLEFWTLRLSFPRWVLPSSHRFYLHSGMNACMDLQERNPKFQTLINIALPFTCVSKDIDVKNWTSELPCGCWHRRCWYRWLADPGMRCSEEETCRPSWWVQWLPLPVDSWRWLCSPLQPTMPSPPPHRPRQPEEEVTRPRDR